MLPAKAALIQLASRPATLIPLCTKIGEWLMAKRPRVSRLIRLGNLFSTALVRAGIPAGPITLLTVRGRKSGLPRTTPVALIEHGERRYLVANFGETQWVRNLRVAQRAVLTRRRRSEPVCAVELPPAAAAPILQYSLSHSPAFLRRQFDVTLDSTLAEFEDEARRHPVFLLESDAAGA
jgi:deazaflavin-dependent oxidoreductase (nitroreductase family)